MPSGVTRSRRKGDIPACARRVCLPSIAAVSYYCSNSQCSVTARPCDGRANTAHRLGVHTHRMSLSVRPAGVEHLRKKIKSNNMRAWIYTHRMSLSVRPAGVEHRSKKIKWIIWEHESNRTAFETGNLSFKKSVYYFCALTETGSRKTIRCIQLEVYMVSEHKRFHSPSPSGCRVVSTILGAVVLKKVLLAL